MSGETVPAARHDVMDAIASLRTLEDTADGQTLIDALKFDELLTRRAQYNTIRTIARLDRDGEFTKRNVAAAEAVADLPRRPPARARRLVAVARAVFPTTLSGQPVQPHLPATATALGTGQIDLAHAEVIEAALNRSAARRLEPETWAGAEKQLAEWAALYRPDELRSLARDLLERLDQDGPPPDDDEAQVNELRLTKSGDGVGGRIKGRLDAETFEVLARAIEASRKPATDEDKTIGQRNADALGEICAHALDEGRLPENGGERPHITVITHYNDLKRGVRGANLCIGGRINGAALRRLACDAAIIAAVFGAHSEPLDVGREKRTATKHQRRLITARDGGCAHPGCHKPPHWCQIHHIRHRVDGGRTAIDNMIMLCWVHHRMVHKSGWQVRMVDGHPEFVPPKWLDINQTPRRNPRTPACRDHSTINNRQ